MDLRPIGTFVAGAAFLTAATVNYAQVSGKGQSSSASHVAAEVTEGRLNPAASKPGDAIVLRLKDDVKSNGTIVLRKGTPITGVVRNVKRSHAQSMIGIEWFSPAAQGKAVQNVSIALHSVNYLNPIHKHEQQNVVADLGQSGVGVVTVSTIGSTTAAASSLSMGSRAGSSGQPNAAMRSMPSVEAVDPQTSSAIENSLGISSSGQLFKVGRGQLVTASGSQQSVDIFSRLNNDTVITSAGKDFEISTGAQMQLLVGVKKK